MTIEVERPVEETAGDGGQLVAASQYPADMPVDRDAVRALLRRKLALRREEDQILGMQEQIIVDAYRDGVKPADIWRALVEAADELQVPEDDRRGLGLTESTVHSVLRPHKRRTGNA